MIQNSQINSQRDIMVKRYLVNGRRPKTSTTNKNLIKKRTHHKLPADLSRKRSNSSKWVVPVQSFGDIYKEHIFEDEREDGVALDKNFLKETLVKDSRRDVLKWIFHYGNKLDQSVITIQTAIIYIDMLICEGKMQSIIESTSLWAGTALLVASKFAELDYKLIRISELQSNQLDLTIF